MNTDWVLIISAAALMLCVVLGLNKIPYFVAVTIAYAAGILIGMILRK